MDVGGEGVKIYVASSWRNAYQPATVDHLRAEGHEVYDFRNPPQRTGFAWSKIDPNWEHWDTEKYRLALNHPVVLDGFFSDFDGMRQADACVLVLPCGRSAHLEAGYLAGRHMPVVVYIPESIEPELMYLLCGAFGNIAVSLEEVSSLLNTIPELLIGVEPGPPHDLSREMPS